MQKIAGILTCVFLLISFMGNASQQPSSKNCSVIVLLGPPGSGKGTQAVRISKVLGFSHISTGDLFREHLKNGTPLGKQVKGLIDAGQLVSDDIVLEILFDRLKKTDCDRGFLLDGFPRTLAQAEALTKRLGDHAKLTVINLDVPDENILKRMSGRLTCKQCGQVYNRHFSPPKIESRCDVCNGDLYQRSDDTIEVVKDRLRVYHMQTKPLIQFYEAKGQIIHINGTHTPEVVYEEILKNIRHL